MDAGLATVLAAVITGFLALIGILVQFRKENHGDHAVVVGSLNRLADGIERVESKIDDHITDHAKGIM
jgi:hypothetical protein